MEPSPIFYDKADYIETHTGNKVSRKSVLCGSQNIRIRGSSIVMPETIIRGDLANINIGKNSFISKNVVLRPPYKRYKGGIAFFPLTIGDCVYIGKETIVNAASVGSYVHVGQNCVISRLCMLKDCCWIEDNSVLAPGTVVPPFTVWGGSPARFLRKLPECFQELQRIATTSNYTQFISKPEEKENKSQSNKIEESISTTETTISNNKENIIKETETKTET